MQHVDPAEAAAAAVAAAGAFAAGHRTILYYDLQHPVSVEHRKSLDSAVRRWQRAVGGDCMFAAAGHSVLITGSDDTAGNDSIRGLCDSMISRSVVAVRLRSPILSRDLDEFLLVMAETDQRVRAAGGVAAILRARGVQTVDVVEMDLEALLAGEPMDPTGMEPMVGKALMALLGFKKAEKRAGSVVEISLERVTSVGSLGAVLDDLIDGAAPDARAPGAPGTRSGRANTGSITGAMRGMSADELADICASAYGKATATARDNPDALTEAAQTLSAALVRISPTARFKLLQKVASHDHDGRSSAALGRAMPNSLLMSALTQVVMGKERDSRLASAIGGLLERVRPIERERQQLIDGLDEAARQSGRPLDGLFMQELNEVSQQKTFGGLDLPFRQNKEMLIRAAQERRQGPGQPELVERLFASLRADHTLQRRIHLLCFSRETEKVVAPATLQSVVELMRRPAQDAVFGDSAGIIVAALWRRAIMDGPTSAASRRLTEVMASPAGPDWCIALLRQLKGQRGPDTGALVAELVKSVVVLHQGETFRRRLADALHDLDRTVLRILERRIGELSPGGIATLIGRAGRDGDAAPLALVQVALRANAHETKEAAIRALAQVPSEPVIEFLRKASGLDGDDVALAVLSAQKLNATATFSLKKTAVEALGISHAAAAVPILQEHLTRVRVLGGAEFDRLRPFAARALSINNTAEARQALDAGRRSRHAAVRAACGGGP
jgi:hypothetical protein